METMAVLKCLKTEQCDVIEKMSEGLRSGSGLLLVFCSGLVALVVGIRVRAVMCWLFERERWSWRGNLVFAISKKVNTNVPVQAEAFAILLAVHIAINFSCCSCIIESDCKVCIDAINSGGNLVPWRLLNFVESVKYVISGYNHVSFNWVHREANKAAHVLANWSLNQSLFGSFDLGFGPPSFVNVILAEASQSAVFVGVQ
ncbi:hypothetical protein SO802_023398 [Lithocarpus litseifolius]|uniref:RNase H type-1 domain-containing protein n=1 Tax=Lithocarpus litseifolius TaxID=425828 RepID=A0AAW2C639_9ROSI